MSIIYIKKIIKKKIEDHKTYKVLYLIAIIHLIRYLLFRNYRKKRCLIDPPADFFYKYKKLINYFSFPLIIVARYFKKKKIFISINNAHNYSPGHTYCEIDLLKRMQHFDDKYYGSTIWFTTSRKEILGETKDVFETKNFKILFGGLKRIFLTFVAIMDPSISINGGVSHANFILGKDNSNRIRFNNTSRRIGLMISKTSEFYPNKDKLFNYKEESNKLLQSLNITKKYVVIQIKTEKVNATFKILNPSSILKTIDYFLNKDYQIVFAGREKFPDIYSNKSIINYANSKYASALNDFLLVGHCSLVISSASGFCFIAENFDKPLLMINTVAGAGNFGRRTIFLPTLLSQRSKVFNGKIQHLYLCTYGATMGRDIFDDLYIVNMPSSEEIFMAAKELEGMLSDIVPSFTPLQKKISDDDGCPLLSCGLSRISDFYLKKFGYFFEK